MNKKIGLMIGLSVAITGWVHGASRIVCLGGAVTETVFTLGAGQHVVAIDDSSSFPSEALHLPRVGYYRMISAEGILSVSPDLIIASEEAGPPEVLRQIEAAGVSLIRVPGTATASGCVARIRAVGVALDREQAAHELADEIEHKLAAFSAEETTKPPVRVLFVFARGAGTLNVSGDGTAADEIIRLAGGINAVIGYQGYRPLTAEAAVVANPDVVLITKSGLSSIGGPDGLWSLPGLSSTVAGQSKRVIAFDDLYLLGFGPRLPEAVAELREALTH